MVQQLLTAGLVDELRRPRTPWQHAAARRLFDEGDSPYHLKVTATEALPTGVIRVIYSPTQAPTEAGYDDVKGRVPEGK